VSHSIRRARDEDAAFIERLFLLPHVKAFLNAPTSDQIVASLKRAGTESYIVDKDGEPVGHLALHDNGFLIDIGVIAVTEPRRGTGSFALECALRRAFEELHAHRVFLEVREDNAAMCRLAGRAGLLREGVYRDGYYHNESGRYVNLCPYGMLAYEYARGAQTWEQRVAQIWASLDDYEEADFRAHIDRLASELSADDPNGIFERACAWDSTGHSDRAVPLYREALEKGLSGISRRRAIIQMASSLRNLNKSDEALALLTAERERASDSLDDALCAFLALALSDVGREREGLALALAALAPHLPRYQRSVRSYAADLIAPEA
jgi:RimJ/RimL family protein N-acetyltransferase